MTLDNEDLVRPFPADTDPPRKAMKSVSASSRGERVYPAKSHHSYWHLICLRQAVEAILEEHFTAHPTGMLVDFGCGNMPYRPLFESHLESYVGCDLPENDLADCVMDESFILPIESDVCDWVLSTQVLEHVDDPVKYLREAHRVLKDNGCLILSTHGVWQYHPDPCDYWRWTCSGLKKQVQAAGFDIMDFRGIMGPAATALQLFQDAFLWKLHRRLRPVFIRFMQYLIKKVDQRCSVQVRDRDACVYMLVARKITD